ncbi:MAG: zinc ABC transporter substrate-binding protein [Methanomicrobiaceae archaeon]|nr:zinc ABC transporter substrate-binding protein [Methanomicrobiaceae archaeon]
MNSPAENIVFTYILIVLAILASGCTSEADSSPAGDMMKVTVTILPQKEFVERVGGDDVEVFVLVPPGASPHSYEPTPSDLAKVSDSDVYVIMGSGIEFELLWLDKIRELNPDITIINSSEGVDLISGENDGGPDPHIWLSPRNVIKITVNIRDGLSAFDPSDSEYFWNNAALYIADLEGLDSVISKEIDESGIGIIMVSHPAWTYFARDYNLWQIAIQEEGKEPSPARIKELIDTAVENNVNVIFISPEFSSSNARVIADETGGEVVVLDPLAEEYIENMRKVSKAFSGEAIA